MCYKSHLVIQLQELEIVRCDESKDRRENQNRDADDKEIFINVSAIVFCISKSGRLICVRHPFQCRAHNGVESLARTHISVVTVVEFHNVAIENRLIFTSK